MNQLLSSGRVRSIVATIWLSLLVVASAGCGSDDASTADTSAPQPSTKSTVAITDAPTTQAPTTQAPTTQAPTTQAPTTQAPTTEAPIGELTQDEASAIADEVITAWNTDDVSPIERLMGPTGVWIGITGLKFDASTVAGWLDPILAGIGDTERTGEPVAVTSGFSFPLVDVSSGGPFFLVITRSPDGVLQFEETPNAPVAGG